MSTAEPHGHGGTFWGPTIASRRLQDFAAGHQEIAEDAAVTCTEDWPSPEVWAALTSAERRWR